MFKHKNALSDCKAKIHQHK